MLSLGPRFPSTTLNLKDLAPMAELLPEQLRPEKAEEPGSGPVGVQLAHELGRQSVSFCAVTKTAVRDKRHQACGRGHSGHFPTLGDPHTQLKLSVGPSSPSQAQIPVLLTGAPPSPTAPSQELLRTRSGR